MQDSGTKGASPPAEVPEAMVESQASAPFPRMSHSLMEARGIHRWALGGEEA